MTLREHGQTTDKSSEHRRGLLITAALAVLLLVVMGGWLIADSQQEGPQPTEATGAPAGAQDDPSPADGPAFGIAERVLVWGNGSCTIAEESRDIWRGTYVSFTCDYTMSDERMSGTETFTAMLGRSLSSPSEYPEEFRFETDGGTWIGVLDPDSEPGLWRSRGGVSAQWDVEYTGTGAYEGLVYYEHFNHHYTGAVTVSGWIDPASDN